MPHCYLDILIARMRSKPILVPRYHNDTFTTTHSHQPLPIKMVEVT